MDHFIVAATARPVARGIIATATTSIAALMISSALAQQQPATPRAPARPAASTPARPPAAAPQAQPAPSAQPAQPAGASSQMPQLIYSQWVKFCVAAGEGNGASPAPPDPKDAAAKAKQVCLTGIDGRMESGMPIVAVVAIEPPADGKRILRITLPIGMQLQHGTRFIVDQTQPLTAPYVTCFTNGCISDYELSADTLGKIKKGKSAVVQGINYNGSAISVPIPLTEFAKAYDGAPTDPKVLEERQKKLEDELKKKGEELQKKANEARQKLEQGGGAAKPQ